MASKCFLKGNGVFSLNQFAKFIEVNHADDKSNIIQLAGIVTIMWNGTIAIDGNKSWQKLSRRQATCLVSIPLLPVIRQMLSGPISFPHVKSAPIKVLEYQIMKQDRWQNKAGAVRIVRIREIEQYFSRVLTGLMSVSRAIMKSDF